MNIDINSNMLFIQILEKPNNVLYVYLKFDLKFI